MRFLFCPQVSHNLGQLCVALRHGVLRADSIPAGHLRTVPLKVSQPGDQLFQLLPRNGEYQLTVCGHGADAVAAAGDGHLALPSLDGGDDAVDTSGVAGECAFKVVSIFVFPGQEKQA